MTDMHKNLEAIFIALLKLSLHEQKNCECLILFRNSIIFYFSFFIAQCNKYIVL